MTVVIGTDHLLLNAMTVFRQCGEPKIEEKDLIYRLDEIARSLVEQGYAVDAEFASRVDENKEYLVSGDVDEEILVWESVGAMAEEKGSRWLFYTDEGDDLFSEPKLDQWLNQSIPVEATARIRSIAAELCPVK